jgi:hypothetical protein
MGSITFLISQTLKTTANQEGRPSFSARVYELGDRFGTYRSARPFVKTSTGTTLIFQIPHKRALS